MNGERPLGDGPYAELFVDTARGPARLGERAMTADGRQLVFRHAGLQLDVMLQCGGPSATFVWGQLCHSGSGRPCIGAHVTLVGDGVGDGTGGHAASATDAFGEFSFTAPRIVEGALGVTTGSARFLCWIVPVDAASSRPGPGGPVA